MIARLINKAIAPLGLKVVRTARHRRAAASRLARLSHTGTKRGQALLSYIVEPFFLKKEEDISNAHHHDWLSWQIGQTFSTLGYDVDVIDYRDRTFVPRKAYDFFIGARTNFQRLAEHLSSDCVKIVHLDTAHWMFNNAAAYRRHLDIKQRRGVVLDSFKWVEPNWAIEHADYATTNWGNQFNVSTYSYAGKPIFQIPLPSCAVYPRPDHKDYGAIRKHFLWFGSTGLVHKGLDLVLEAFARMPEMHLTVCGPLRVPRHEGSSGPLPHDARFEAAFHRELYETANIHTVGWVDVESHDFQHIVNRCVGVVFPSCSEGGGASVVSCMQAGLLPIVTRETNVEVGDFGFTLPSASIEDIQHMVQAVSALPIEDMKARSFKTWQFCQAHHTRKQFASAYHDVITQIMFQKSR